MCQPKIAPLRNYYLIKKTFYFGTENVTHDGDVFLLRNIMVVNFIEI